MENDCFRYADGDLRIDPVTDRNRSAFLTYCAAHGPAHDDSFLPKPDFSPNADNPSFLIYKSEQIRGAASLLLSSSYRFARKTRFSILHAGGAGRGSRCEYRALLAASASAAASEADEIYLFLPSGLAEPTGYLTEVGFTLRRVSYSMRREDPALAPAAFPPGYRVVPLRPEDDERLSRFAEARNRNFREVPGSGPVRAEDLRDFLREPASVDGGLCLLVAPDGSPCGTLLAECDAEQDTLSVGALSVDPEHRGRGLGRSLLRTAAEIGRREGLSRLSLSVDALNQTALRLYLGEGFTVRGAFACLQAGIPDLLQGLKADGGDRE